MRRWGALCFALCLPVGLARAQDIAGKRPDPEGAAPASADSDQAKAFFEIGAHAYERGHYADAISAFEQAYRIAHRAGLLFSIAQARRRAFYSSNDPAQLALAVEQYRAYLSADAEGARRADAEHALAELVPMQAEQARRDASPEGTVQATRLMISSSTPGASVLLDHHPVGELPLVSELAPGPHQVIVSAPGFRSEQRDVSLPEGTSFAVNVDLVEEPGSLVVTGPSGSELFLEGRSLGLLPLPRISLSAGSHRVSLRRPGYELTSAQVRVARATQTTVQLAPKTTRRRDLSFVLLGVGVAAGASALALGGVALVQEGKAQSLLDRSRERAWTPSEYQQYRSATNRRDDFRNGGLVSAGLGGALSLTSLLLYLTEPNDPPPLEDAPAPRSEPRKSPEIWGSLRATERSFAVDLTGHF